MAIPRARTSPRSLWRESYEGNRCAVVDGVGCVRVPQSVDRCGGASFTMKLTARSVSGLPGRRKGLRPNISYCSRRAFPIAT